MSFPEFQHIYHLHFIISPGLALVVGIAAGLFVLYTLTLAIYSIYFSPLRKIPGPKLWIAFPILRHLAEFSGNMDRQIRAFHETYGEVVRLADDEVSFTTAKAWSDIHGHGHRQLPKVLQFEKDDSQILQSNDFDHARYRKALSPAFSEKALRDQEPLMKVHIDLLIEKLKDVAASESRADMVQWYNLTTFDLIGDLAFGEPFRGLIDQKIHHWIANIFLLVKLGPVVRAARTYPLLTELFGLFLPRDLRQSRETQNEFSRSIVTNRIHNEAQHGRGDFMDSMLKHKDDKDALTFKELVANATVLIIAGSETTATLLSGVTYWLLKTPLALKKVTEEVRSQFQSEQEIDFIHASSRLPYMLACLDEGLRRYPPVPTGIRRITLPDGPSIIAGVELPPNTKVAVHQSAAYWTDRNFYNAKSFHPERWLAPAKEDPASPFYNDNRSVLQPFHLGPRNCIGKNLAYNEMRLILARILWNFDIELCAESEGWAERQKSRTLWEKPPLWCRLKARKVE